MITYIMNVYYFNLHDITVYTVSIMKHLSITITGLDTVYVSAFLS